MLQAAALLAASFVSSACYKFASSFFCTWSETFCTCVHLLSKKMHPVSDRFSAFRSVRSRQPFLMFEVLYDNSIFICVFQIFYGIKDRSWKRYSSIAQILEVNIHEFETILWSVQTVLCSTRGGGDVKGTEALYGIEWSPCLVQQYSHRIRIRNGLYTFFVIFVWRRERSKGKFSQKEFDYLHPVVYM